MNYGRFTTFSLLVLLISATASSVAAQKPKPAEALQKSTSKSSVPVDPELAQRRSVALSELRALAIEARSYRDEALRARTQARVADALWDQDVDGARTLFRRAWEVAENVDAESGAGGTAMPGRRGNNPSGPSARPRTILRAEVLRLAARRDYTLGEEFLARMAGAKKDEVARADDSPGSASPLSDAEIRERLRLAGEFLAADNVPRALQFADPALVQVTTRTILFLIELRDKNATAADQRFAELLARAASDPASDANTVSLLTTYAFTPSIFLVVSASGFPSSTAFELKAAPDLRPALRNSFFRAAANILLRPLAQVDQSSAGRAGAYFIGRRVFPLFQQFAPDLAPALATQLAALGPDAARGATNAGDRAVNQGMGRSEPTGDEIGGELEDRLKSATGTDARDRAYAFAATRAADTGDPRALEFVDKIEDLETRRTVRTVVNYNSIQRLLRQKNAEEAVRLARKSDLSHLLLAHVLTSAAEILSTTDRRRALELIDEALTEARRLDAGTSERAYSLVALLALLSRLDKVRSWELVSETVKAANAVSNFTGENGHTSLVLEGKFSVSMGTELAGANDLRDSFAALAEDDFYQAIGAGKTFQADAPRALVTVAIARAVLEGKGDKAVLAK
ncbi:MAG: hypothetical protein QOD75_2777 [Blastocatellia bacterium]|jgi:hypothetical protein|nr:hypothetical protein [Blastocatellia bacterium]